MNKAQMLKPHYRIVWRKKSHWSITYLTIIENDFQIMVLNLFLFLIQSNKRKVCRNERLLPFPEEKRSCFFLFIPIENYFMDPHNIP